MSDDHLTQAVDLKELAIKTEQVPINHWFSMDSAPLYERILLLYRARNLIVCGRWEEDKWRSRSAPKPFWTNDKLTTIGITRLRAEPPDGWMPLPGVRK